MMILLKKLSENSLKVSYKYSGFCFGIIEYDKANGSVIVKDDMNNHSTDGLLVSIVKSLVPEFPDSYTYAAG